MLGERCERCKGKGEVVYAYRNRGETEWDRDVQTCPVCLGLGSFVSPSPKPSRPDGFIALHSRALDWNEVVSMLPVREPVTDWEREDWG